MSQDIKLSKREVFRRYRLYKRALRKGLIHHYRSKKEFWSYNVSKRSEYLDEARRLLAEIEKSL